MSKELTRPEVERLTAETEKFQAEARQALAEERYNLLLVDKLEREKEIRDAAEYTHRIYTFDMDVNPKSVQDCISTMGVWARQDPTRPIQVIFNSPGGSVFDGLALYDYIMNLRQNGTRVDTVGLGMVASMAGPLLQAGEKRTLTPSSWFLIHEISSFKMFSVQKLSDQEEEVKFKKRLMERLVDILADRSDLTAEEITKKCWKRDWWLSAHEAFELGFADEVK